MKIAKFLGFGLAALFLIQASAGNDFDCQVTINIRNNTHAALGMTPPNMYSDAPILALNGAATGTYSVHLDGGSSDPQNFQIYGLDVAGRPASTTSLASFTLRLDTIGLGECNIDESPALSQGFLNNEGQKLVYISSSHSLETTTLNFAIDTSTNLSGPVQKAK